MLYNIFLLKGKNIQDLNNLNIYSYPRDIIDVKKKDIIQKVLLSHEDQQYRKKKADLKKKKGSTREFVFDTPVPQIIDGLNLYSTRINENIYIGLIFNQEDNPYDYKAPFEDILNELLNIKEFCSFDDETEIENLLISIFIDLRRYGDEIIEKFPEVEFHHQQDSFVKVFLFGIDEAGKTSFIRRVKTGKYNDNFFTPTRKFNIEYINREEKDSLIAFWDMPGQKAMRSKWLIGLQDSNIIIFMIDIANQLRFEESKQEFWRIISRYELAGVPLLVLGNKVDLLNHRAERNKEQIKRTKKEIFQFFEFDKIKNRPWKFIFSSVKTNYNMDRALQTIYDLIEK
ncbi:MAG: GTP-binding domain protein [Promethearchaeota archaeon]|nr:MAG: GTP-binding domain protein [Candidatus Lokiarchaeota archaeon]